MEMQKGDRAMKLPADVVRARKAGERWPRTITIWSYGQAEDPAWERARIDGRRFIGEGWPRQAARLGWTEENAVGLIWSLRGRRVIAMTARRAAIMGADGGVTFFRRMAR
jgi:hypothetical protein